MLARRIIPCLDVSGGRVVKGVHFESLRDAGDPVSQAARYDAEGADELVFLDISATHEERRTTLDMVSQVADTVFIPVTVGGGIRSVSDGSEALRAGADKIAVNTAAGARPGAGRPPGQQLRNSVRRRGGGRQADRRAVHRDGDGGAEQTSLEAIEWIRKLEALGAGEILLTSMDRDGTQAGYDLPLLRAAAASVRSGDCVRRGGEARASG
jgi:cyclase